MLYFKFSISANQTVLIVKKVNFGETPRVEKTS